MYNFEDPTKKLLKRIEEISNEGKTIMEKAERLCKIVETLPKPPEFPNLTDYVNRLREEFEKENLCMEDLSIIPIKPSGGVHYYNESEGEQEREFTDKIIEILKNE